jgi:formiminotetrahydrofolate cyclodeaminase
MTSLVEAFKATADELMQAADEDSDAFAALTVAFAMDRETEEQKQARRAAIAAESRRALQPPLKAARASLRTLMDVEQLSREFNKQLASDVVVAVHTLRAGLYGALAQVEVNLALTDDESFIAAMVAEVESMRARADDLVEKVDGRMQAIIAP